MYAIKGIFDGKCFRLEESIPVKEEYKVVITFIDPVKRGQESIFDYFGTWTEADAASVNAVISERKNFTLGREQA
ncbi:MAG: hypothetical protein LBG12_08050 [Synergistaceae bacterium]|jgi:hypothetical protein|nr:hypothetical protein [Synergistaceae bacterium]